MEIMVFGIVIYLDFLCGVCYGCDGFGVWVENIFVCVKMCGKRMIYGVFLCFGVNKGYGCRKVCDEIGIMWFIYVVIKVDCEVMNKGLL